MRARAGLTLLEVVISGAIIAMLSLAILSATLPLSDASTASAIALDMDQTATRVLSQLRREVRQSGSDGAVDHVVEPATPTTGNTTSSTLRFTVRTGVGAWSADELRYALVPDSRQATYVGVPGTIARFQIDKTFGGRTADIAHDVESLTFERVANSPTLRVRLVLLRPDPKWRSGAPPAPIRRTYEDEIELMNQGG